MSRIDQLIRGWGAAFAFVTNRASLAQLDREIDRRLAAFDAWYRGQFADLAPRPRRRLRGIALLGDTPPRVVDGPPRPDADTDAEPLTGDD
jgi:hypothetical protein